MYCSSCGALLPEKAAFCPSCGARAGGGGCVPLVCPVCGGNRLKRLRTGEYRCEHCGSVLLTERRESAENDAGRDARLDAIFAEAAGYEEKDDFRAELRVLARGLDVAPDSCTLMLKLGRAYWRLGYTQKAQEYYRRAQELNPDDPVVYINLGSLYLTGGLYAEARPQYEKGLALIEADPLSATPGDAAVAYGNYALCLGRLGDPEGAERTLRIAKEKGYRPESIDYVCRTLGLDRSKI